MARTNYKSPFPLTCPKCEYPITDPAEWDFVFEWCRECTEKEVAKTTNLMLLNDEQDGPPDKFEFKRRQEFTPASIQSEKVK